jgi:hypothetical protein
MEWALLIALDAFSNARRVSAFSLSEKNENIRNEQERTFFLGELRVDVYREKNGTIPIFHAYRNLCYVIRIF